jgi:hypothetical protein
VVKREITVTYAVPCIYENGKYWTKVPGMTSTMTATRWQQVPTPSNAVVEESITNPL